MSDAPRFDLEKAIATWRSVSERSTVFSADDLAEIEQHLRDHTGYLIDGGAEPEAAFREAVQEFGDPLESENDYRQVYWSKLRHTGRLSSELRHRLDLAANYVVVAARNLKRHVVVTGINLFGLSIAVGAALTVFLVMQNYRTMGHFHEHADRLWMIGHTIERGGDIERWGRAPAAIDRDLAATIPGVEQSVRMRWDRLSIRLGGESFEEMTLFVDTSFFDMFTFPLDSRSPGSLRDADTAILSARAAARMFGERDPVGETIAAMTSDGRPTSLTVRGVAAPFPDNTALRWDIVVPWHAQLPEAREASWSNMSSGVVLRLAPGADPADVERHVAGLVDRQQLADPEHPVQSFFLDGLTQPVERAWTIRGRMFEAPHPAFIAVMASIPLVMLLLACFNAINIAIGMAERRIREIGVRKVVGGRRSQLVLQFLTENVVLTSASVATGALLAAVFFIPKFNELFVYHHTGGIPFGEAGFWLFAIGLVAVVSLAAGLYPALYISKFKPTVIFRGRTAFGGNRLFTRLFLGIQFVLVFVSAILGIYLARGEHHFRNLDWGYDASRVVVARIHDEGSFDALRSRLEARPEIESVAGARTHLGVAMDRANLLVDGREMISGRFGVTSDYLSAMGIPLREGRPFEAGFEGDILTEAGGSALVNETFARKAGWTDPVGRIFRQDGAEFTVVGVVRDVMDHPMIAPPPEFFVRMPNEQAAMAIIRVAGGAASGGVAAGERAVKSVWAELYPGAEPDVFRQSSVFDVHLESFGNLTGGLVMLAVLALLIASFGLYGLASQGLAARMKEMGVRKVLGATATGLAWRANRRFLAMVTIAAAIAIPLCYAAITFALSQFETSFPNVGAEPFVGAYLLIAGVAALALARHTLTLVRVQPADALRDE